MTDVNVIVLRAAGINCDEETMHCWCLAGASPRLVHVHELVRRPELLDSVSIVTIPGGFSYGDDLGAGVILAQRIRLGLGDALRRFVDRGGGVLGICNGLQVLIRLGLLPGREFGIRALTITDNATARFEARWVKLEVSSDRCPFLVQGAFLELPVEHAQGRIITACTNTTRKLLQRGHIALRYVDASGPTEAYPANPNGSVAGIAGLCDATGRILGLMPHPDRFFDETHHPLWMRSALCRPPDGLTLFQSAVRFWEGRKTIPRS